jgi:hypothetical protein
MRRVTAYCANLFDDLEVQCNVGRRAALDVNCSNHGAGGTGPLARSFHSQSIIAKPGDGRAHIDRRATVITFVETDRWITNSSGNVGVQLCLAVALKELKPSCGRRAPPDRQALDNFGGMHIARCCLAKQRLWLFRRHRLPTEIEGLASELGLTAIGFPKSWTAIRLSGAMAICLSLVP